MPTAAVALRSIALGAVVAIAILPFMSTAQAQRVDFVQPLLHTVDAGVDLGSGDTRTARNAVLAVGDRTWVTGRRDDPGEDDVYVARFGPDGTQELYREYDLGGGDTGIALADAGGGAVYVAARTSSQGPQRITLLRVQPDGALAWRRELENAGTWAFLQNDLVLLTDGQGGLVVGLNGSQQDGAPLFFLARLQDAGTAAMPVWQSTLQPPARAYDQLGLAWSSDGSRIALAALAFVQFNDPRPFVAVVAAANGGVIASTLGAGPVNRVLPPRYAPDGTLRVATKTQFAPTVGLLRFNANGGALGATSTTCSTADCEIDDLTVTTDGATFVVGTDFNGSGALLLRFTAAGAPDWSRRYAFGARSNGRVVSAAGTSVDIGLDARIDANDRGTSRWLVGRVDASGTPSDASGFLVTPSRSANLVAASRGAGGTLSLAGDEAIDLGRVVVAQIASAESAPRFLVGFAPTLAPAEFRGVAVELRLDPDGRPVLAFDRRGNDLRGFSVRAFAADGTLRWSADSDPLLREQEPSLAVDALGRASVISTVGNFPQSQFGARLFAADGAPLQGPSFVAEPGISLPVSALAADGTRLLAATVGDASIAIRLIEANGQTRWRRTITTGGSFPRVWGVFRLPSGDAALLYTPGFGVTQALIGQRFAQSDGTPGPASSANTTNFGFPQRLIQREARVFAAVTDDERVRFPCFDFAADALCFNQQGPTGDTATFADLRLDASGSRLFAALTTFGGAARPRMLALDATTGQIATDVTLTDRPIAAVRGVFVRDGNPVLVADRAADGGAGSPGLELFTLSPLGAPISQASLNAGQRLELLRVEYDETSDRAYLVANRTPLDGATQPSLIGVAFDRPPQVFADGFE